MPIQFFHIVLEYVLSKYEGIYSNDPDDKGGETFKGIARNKHPNLDLWNIIDSFKQSEHFINLIKNDKQLNSLVSDFYFTEFWKPLHCDIFPHSIAAELFESAINFSPKSEIQILQKTLNLLNKNEERYSDIETDGIFGQITLRTSNYYFDNFPIQLFFKVLNVYQAFHYVHLMENNPVYEKYIGFFNRVTFNTNFVFNKE